MNEKNKNSSTREWVELSAFCRPSFLQILLWLFCFFMWVCGWVRLREKQGRRKEKGELKTERERERNAEEGLAWIYARPCLASKITFNVCQCPPDKPGKPKNTWNTPAAEQWNLLLLLPGRPHAIGIHLVSQ